MSVFVEVYEYLDRVLDYEWDMQRMIVVDIELQYKTQKF